MKGVLHINSEFAFLGCPPIKAEIFKFPGGESHIKIHSSLDGYDAVIISARVQNGDHLMQVALAKDALERSGVENVELFMPYMPYARQDRAANRGESLSLKVVTSFLNSLNFKKITLQDAHSDVATALLDNVRSYMPISFVMAVARDLINFQLVYPDAGATKKYHIISSMYNENPPITCTKHRDTESGKLDGFKLSEKPIEGETCLIVDDICDGGRTFIEISKLLKLNGAKKVYLYVTHGIFSNGFADLFETLDGIYCTNSFSDVPLEYTEPHNFKQFKLIQ